MEGQEIAGRITRLLDVGGERRQQKQEGKQREDEVVAEGAGGIRQSVTSVSVIDLFEE